MKKQIFIPKPDNHKLGLIHTILADWLKNETFAWSKEFQQIVIIGLVNQQLGLKANCKEITFVEYVDEINLMDETRKGYLVTYLESEMQFAKSDIAYYRMIAEDLTAEKL